MLNGTKPRNPRCRMASRVFLWFIAGDRELLDRNALQALGCWTGYRLERVEWPQREVRTLSLYLKPVSEVMYCEQCGACCQQIHETTVQCVFFTAGTSYSFDQHAKLEVALPYAFPKSFPNGGLPGTSVPIEVRHSQIAASLAFTKRFRRLC